MAIIGININRDNTEFTAEDFTFWMPQFGPYIATTEGAFAFEKLLKLANAKIFYSIFGSDWELAMCYCIAHYLTLVGQQTQAPSGPTLGEVAGGGSTKGVIQSATIGGFSKTYDLTKTMLDSQEALFWNQTSYGSQLMALYKTKAVPSILVVTSYPIPGAN